MARITRGQQNARKRKKTQQPMDNIKIRSKKELFKKYYFLSDREIRANINEIIAQVRKIPMEEARLKRKLRPIEVQRFEASYDVEKPKD